MHRHPQHHHRASAGPANMWLHCDMPRFSLAHAAHLLRDQDGVVARTQLHDLGARPHDIARLVRRRELARAFDGVLVAHTGPLTPRQRDWVAVLAAAPAALTGRSALPGARHGPPQIVVAAGRKVVVPAGTTVRRADDLESRVEWNRLPPRVRIEHALIEAMSDHIVADDVASAFQKLTEIVYERRTTIERIETTLESRTRIPGRSTIRALLHDLRDGAWSVLERGYLHRVERAHGLPAATRQHVSSATGSITKRDIRYVEFGLVLELDGGTHRNVKQAAADAFRDLSELAVTGSPTGRVTYGLVFDTPCKLARVVAQLLQQRGWGGSLTPCSRCRRPDRERHVSF